MRLLSFTALVVLGLSACSSESVLGDEPTRPVVSAEDFKIIEGDDWVGSLTYLDYSSYKRVTIPTEASVKVLSSTSLKYSVSYPKEPWEDTKAKLKISKSGRNLDGHPVIYRDVQPNGSLEIRTLHQGEDNSQPASIQMTYVLSTSQFTMSKDVSLGGTKEFTNRNIYSFNRP